MRNILTIMKKELRRFFTDTRMLATIFLPGILIYVVYSLMGGFMADMMTTEADYQYQVYVANQPQIFAQISETDAFDINITEVDLSSSTISDITSMLKEQKIDLFVVYDADFEAKLAISEQPNVAIYYNSISTSSTEVYTYYHTALSSAASVPLFGINTDINTQYDMATEEDISAMMITMVMPLLLIMLLFAGCMSITTESIAGEKERGTIATLLVTPTKRSHIALGKVIALSITSLLSAVSSFLGVLFSLPKLVQGGVEMDISLYGVVEYLQIFAILVSTILVFTVVLSIVSCFAKSVKEASSYATPVMILVMVCGFGNMFGGGVLSNHLLYVVPVLNSVQCITSIFSMSFDMVNFIITIVSNMVYLGVGIFVLTKMFDNEKIMFNK